MGATAIGWDYQPIDPYGNADLIFYIRQEDNRKFNLIEEEGESSLEGLTQLELLEAIQKYLEEKFGEE